MKFSQLVKLAEETVTAAQNALPPDLRLLARALPLSYEPLPNDAILADGMEPDILGLFVGPPYSAAQAPDLADVPPQILLFLGNLWDYAEADVQIFCEEIRLTYLHELGHYLGWDEEDLAARGLD